MDQKQKDLVMAIAKTEADELIAAAERYEKLASISREKAAKILELSVEASSQMIPSTMRDVICMKNMPVNGQENMPVNRIPVVMAPASMSYCGRAGRAWYLPR